MAILGIMAAMTFEHAKKGGGENVSFVSVLKQAAAQEGKHGIIETFPDNSRVEHDFDDITPPLSQSRWFQTSAKAVRMSVLAHLKRSEQLHKVNKQLREWADNKVAEYSDVCFRFSP